MNPFEVYKLYLAIKLHFTTDRFDYFKCCGKTKASMQAFEKRKDVYFFKKLATKYSREELIEYFVANFVGDESTWIGNISRIENSTVYPRWKEKIKSMPDTFKRDVLVLLNDNSFEDIFKVSHTHPPIIVKYLSKSISLETLVILNVLLNYVKDFDATIKEPVIWPDLKRKVVKYEPFLSVDKPKYKHILLDQL